MNVCRLKYWVCEINSFSNLSRSYANVGMLDHYVPGEINIKGSKLFTTM